MTATIDADLRLLLEWVFENALDEDKSGFIEEREANRVAKYCGYGGPDGDITALWTTMLREMDTDGDQRISMEEYVVFMSKSLEGSVAAARNLADEVDAKLNQKAALDNTYAAGGSRDIHTASDGASDGGEGARSVGPHDRGLPRPGEHLRAARTARRPRAPARQAPQVGVDGEARRQATLGDDGRGAARPRAAAPAGPREGRAGRLLLGRGGEGAQDKRSTGGPLTQLPIVSVSHAWETSVHPDPRGANLLLLVDAIKRAQTTQRRRRAATRRRRRAKRGAAPLLLGGILRLLLSFTARSDAV